MLIKTLKSSEDKMSKLNVTVYKVKSSEGDCSSKCEQKHNLVLICSDCRRFKIFIRFTDLHESYVLQADFVKTARTTLRIPIFDFNLEF